MGHFSTDLARIARRQHGIISGAQLRHHGIDAELTERLRSRGLLVRTHSDIYRVATAEDSFASRCVTTCLADDLVVIGGAAAAALWDFDHVYVPTRPEALIPRSVSATDRVRGVAYRRCPLLADINTVRRGDGIRVLNRAWTWLDCASFSSSERCAQLTRHVLDSQCDLDELWDVVDRFEARRRGTPGRASVTLNSRRSWRRPRTLRRAA